MARYVVLRLLLIIPVWMGVSMLAFGLASLAPGDPATILARRASDVPPTAAQLAALRKELRLDEPFLVRYGDWLREVAGGDLGRSLRTREPVLEALLARVPATLELALLALVFAVALALPLGVWAAARPGEWPDHLARLVALAGAAMPSYWLAYLLIIIFALQLQWLPVGGRQHATSALLPAATLAIGLAAVLARFTRAHLLEVLHEGYIRAARARGVGRTRVIWLHGVPNALLPLVAVAGIMAGHLLTGAVVVEEVFAWPGVGRLLLESILDRDYPVIQGFVLLAGSTFVLIALAMDLLYRSLDPRVEIEGLDPE